LSIVLTLTVPSLSHRRPNSVAVVSQFQYWRAEQRKRSDKVLLCGGGRVLALGRDLGRVKSLVLVLVRLPRLGTVCDHVHSNVATVTIAGNKLLAIRRGKPISKVLG
jgi:hypothetical protein